MKKLSKQEKQQAAAVRHQAYFLKHKNATLMKLSFKLEKLKLKQKVATQEKVIIKLQGKIVQLETAYRLLNEQQQYDPESLSNFILKRWFFGVGKEFLRIDWAKRRAVFINFFIILVVVVFLALLFLLIDTILLPAMKTSA